MRIGIDATVFKGSTYTGVSRCAYEIIRNWIKRYPEHEYFLFSGTTILPELILPDNWHRVVKPCVVGGAQVWNIIELPKLIKQNKIDAFWGPNFILPKKNGNIKYYVTVHDLAPFKIRGIPTIVQYIWPGFLKGYMYTVAGFDIYVTWVILAVLVAILITYINIRGIKTAAILQTVLTFTIAGVGIILVFASAINGSPNNLDGQLLLGNGTGTFVKNILSIAVVAPFFLFGFDVIPQVAEEINVPLKKLGKLLILSIVLAVLFYALIVFSVSYAISPMEVDASRHSTGLVTADAMAKVFNSKIMAKVAIIGGMCGIITSWNSFLIGGSRALFALAESYMIPHCFSKLHPKYNTPVLSLLLIGVLSVISPFFGKSMLVWISNSASFACCIAYCMVAISFLVLRKKMANEPRPYKVKHFKFVGVMAIFMAGFMVLVYIFPWFGCNLVKQEWIIIGGWGTLGIIFSAICKMVYKDKYGVML